MNEITKVFNTTPVRIIQKNGSPWFVAKDVCNVLEIKNNRDTISKCLDEDEKGVDIIYPLSGSTPIQMTIINESGLYSLILRSRKPEAKEFKRWITHEVLPSIRKTGAYSVGAMKSSTEELVDQINRKLLSGEPVPQYVLEYATRISAPVTSAPVQTPPSPPPSRSLPKPALSRTAQISLVFRALPEIQEFLDHYTEWTAVMDFVNDFYMKYADFVCGIDRSRWWDALQRIRPLERNHTPRCRFIRFRKID